MKVTIAVYVVVSPEWGGSYSYAVNVLEALARFPEDKFVVEVWYMEDCWKGFLKSYPHIKGHAVKRGFEFLLHRVAAKAANTLGFRRTRELQRTAQSIAERQIKQLSPVLCICPQHGSLNLGGQCFQLSAVHDLMHIYEPEFSEVGAPAIIAARNEALHEVVRNCTDILVDSSVGAQHMAEHTSMAAQHLRVLPYTVSRAMLAATPRKPPHALPEKFFFYPAQFWEHKNHANLIKALALLTSRHEDAHCVFVGTTDKNGYEKTMREIGALHMEDHVTILDFVPLEELVWLYRHARALIMPTFFGPTNIPPLEAMSFGCPVAISAIYGMPEQCSDAALYFDPRSPADMAEVMERLWTDDDLRRDLIRNGIERMKSLGHEAFEKRLLSLICSIVNPGNGEHGGR